MRRFSLASTVVGASLLCSAGLLGQAPAPQRDTSTAPISTTSVAPDSAASPDLSSLKARVEEYYAAMVKNDRTVAGQYVTSDSREQFAGVNYTGLRSVKIEKMNPEADGSVSVAVTRTQMVPGFGSMDYRATDIWRPADGQWYLWLAPLQPPFPVAKFSADPGSKNAPARTDEELKARIGRAERNVDSDQYMLQLNKAMQADAQRKAEEQAKVEAAKKAEQEQADPAAKTSKKKEKKKRATLPPQQ